MAEIPEEVVSFIRSAASEMRKAVEAAPSGSGEYEKRVLEAAYSYISDFAEIAAREAFKRHGREYVRKATMDAVDRLLQL